MTKPPRLKRFDKPPRVGIVHFGPGAFFRAFNAVYTNQAMAAAGGDWGICAVSLKSSTARDQLAPQGGVYTAVTLGPDGKSHDQIGAIAEVLVAPEDPDAVIVALADPNVHVVSLTITEKGYGYDPLNGGLDPTHPDIAADLSDPESPQSAVGFIVAGLEVRRQAETPPFTVLSCDNLSQNGAVMRAVVLDYAQRINPNLADWIKAHVRFPSTMVDRITPATTHDDLAEVARAINAHDAACVVHEPFRQWVIEDNFAAPRPAWETASAQFVKSVEAHELMKLRCLNGTHSTLAYLGYLAGHDTIAAASNDPDFAALCQHLWAAEIIPTLPTPEGEDLTAYCHSLLTRYQNPAIKHLSWQIAMDGSQKLPPRLLGTIADHLDQERMPRGLCLAVAAWMRYVGGVDEQGAPIDVRDPLAASLKAAFDAGIDAAAKVDAFLQMDEVFPKKLAQNAAFRAALTNALSQLLERGAKATVAGFVAGTAP